MFSQGLMILTLIRAIQNWRMNTNRLYAILVNHSISYYACGLRELTLVRATFPYSSLSWSVLSGEYIHIATPPGAWISRMPCMSKSLMFRTLVLLPLHVAWVCTSTPYCLFLLTILELTVSSSWSSPSSPLACTSISGRWASMDANLTHLCVFQCPTCHFELQISRCDVFCCGLFGVAWGARFGLCNMIGWGVSFVESVMCLTYRMSLLRAGGTYKDCILVGSLILSCV
jgi:hypothetical protein